MININDVIILLNPWWVSKSSIKELSKPYKRHYYEKIKGLEKYKQIIILTGLRRVGKSTLLYQTIERLSTEVNLKNIFYFSFDKEVSSLIELFERYKELTEIDYKKEKIFVFLDEITKLNKWASELKLIYDSCPNIKFYISSSSSINLEEQSIINLAGRYFLINIYPLSFKEFLELTGNQGILENQKLYERGLKKQFFHYITKSFPETILWDNELIIKDYLKTTIIDKIIKTDLPEKFTNINTELLYNLLEIFYKEPGYYLDFDNLSKNLRISKNTLYKHVYYLEFCYLIRIIKNFRPNTLSASRKLQRVYPYWWNLAYGYCENNDKIIENLISSSIDSKYYWRDKEKEIDFIKLEKKEIIPIEVKNKEKIDERDLNTLKFFMNKYKIKKAILAYKGDELEKKYQNSKIEIIPFWKFLLKEKKK